MNGDLLRDVAWEVEKDAEAFDMNSWTNLPGKATSLTNILDELNNLSDPDCGTTCCVAGWTVRLNNLEMFKKLTLYEFLFSSARAGNASPELLTELQKFFQEKYDCILPSLLWQTIAGEYLEMSKEDANYLFNSDNGPLNGLTAAQALEKIAAGTPMHEVWGCEEFGEDWEEVYQEDLEDYYVSDGDVLVWD